MSGFDVIFAAVGALTAAAAVLAVLSKSMLHSALWLVVCLGGVAGCYLVLGAELVALVQVLVYVGAIVVLVLFALMVTREGADSAHISRSRQVLAAIVGGATTLLLATTLVAAFGTSATRIAGVSNETVAQQIFATHVWPFELLSLLLLIALVAALVLSARRPQGRAS